MLTEFGHIFLVLALACSVYGLVASLWGAYRKNPELILSGERAALAVAAFLTLAAIALIQALVTSDFRYEYVASYTSRALPVFFKFTALWAGQAGSLLFWDWILAMYIVTLILTYRKTLSQDMPVVLGILMGVTIFFTSLVVFVTSPFAKLPTVPPDGHGLNPLLQHWAMIIHPPILYLGYVGFSIPFAFALGALILGKTDNQWVRTVRRWTIVPWFFLGIGMLLGGKWAYMELGWGGYWAWDPVENAAMMPWLTGTAFLHSIIIQEKKDMLKIWNIVLIFLTFALSIFGTFLTRSGVISSVHSFTQSSIGPLFLGFVVFILVSSFAILYLRYPYVKSTARLESVVSRESAFLINNVVFVGACFAVFWGTVFPVVSEAVRGVKITVGPPFFNSVNVPIFLFLLFLTGVGPLVAWRKSSLPYLKKLFLWPTVVFFVTLVTLFAFGMRHLYALLSFSLGAFVIATIVAEFHRGAKARTRAHQEGYLSALWNLTMKNKRRYGGYIVHFGIVLLFFGVAGSAFDREVDVSLKKGESMQLGHYEVVYKGSQVGKDAHKEWLVTTLELRKDGRPIKEIYPQRHFYLAQEQPTTEVAVYSTLKEDFYVVLAGLDDEEGTEAASFKIYLKPLVSLVWLGGMVLTLGTFICLLPDPRPKPRTPVPAHAMEKKPQKV